MDNLYIFQKHAGYLDMKISGVYRFEEFISLPEIILKECRQEKLDKVLVDTSDVDYSALVEMHRYDLGKELANNLGYRIKIAVIVPAIHINKFMETVAINRGARVLVVSCIDSARQWLNEEL